MPEYKRHHRQDHRRPGIEQTSCGIHFNHIARALSICFGKVLPSALRTW
jgi:hypothetical protein